MQISTISIPVDRTEILKTPPVTGVYLFTKKGKILYIGKAINIKARLISHLENAKEDKKESLIVENSDTVEYIETDSEFKALLLESKLIQTHHPRYNVRWRDDKSYLYIKVTVKDEYPKILTSRRERDKKSRYFGPFPSNKSIEEIVRHIRRIFPFCTQKSLSPHSCFYAKIGLCDPCPNMINKIKDERLKKEFKAHYKKNIRQVIRIFEGKTESVQKSLYQQIDKFSEAQDYEEALEWRNKLHRFEKLIYQRLFDTTDIEDYNQSEKSLKELLSILKPFVSEIDNLHRIECYDISNLTLKEATASMVVMEDGHIKKNQYRKFRIKNPKARSDFEMLAEVIKRRFKNKWDEPDLLLIDGGRPQVRTILVALSEIEKKVPVIGIAKNPDRLIVGSQDLSTIRPSLNNKGFNLLRHLRDESHRFAKKYHVHLRNKKLLYPDH